MFSYEIHTLFSTYSCECFVFLCLNRIYQSHTIIIVQTVYIVDICCQLQLKRILLVSCNNTLVTKKPNKLASVEFHFNWVSLRLLARRTVGLCSNRKPAKQSTITIDSKNQTIFTSEAEHPLPVSRLRFISFHFCYFFFFSKSKIHRKINKQKNRMCESNHWIASVN